MGSIGVTQGMNMDEPPLTVYLQVRHLQKETFMQTQAAGIDGRQENIGVESGNFCEDAIKKE